MKTEFEKLIEEQNSNIKETNPYTVYEENTYDTEIGIYKTEKSITKLKVRFWFDSSEMDTVLPDMFSAKMNIIYSILYEITSVIQEEFNNTKYTKDEEAEVIRKHFKTLLNYKFINAVQVILLKHYHDEDIGFVFYKNWP